MGGGKTEKKMGCRETNIELPEEAKKLLDTMIHNRVEDFLKKREWRENAEGINN